jgi:hypothetical protein
MQQIERALHQEVMLRLKSAPLAAMVIAVPNSLWIPTRTIAEKTLAARIVSQMKNNGMLTPGAPDLIFCWSDGSGFVELKRPAQRHLFGKTPKGRLSAAQKEMAEQPKLYDIRYAICDSWPSLRDTLIGWGRLPATWENAA